VDPEAHVKAQRAFLSEAHPVLSSPSQAIEGSAHLADFLAPLHHIRAVAEIVLKSTFY
jgi:hypothetical protein